jgi:phosphoadenosine phosphosulfate reductase
MTESTETLTKNASLGLDSPIARGGDESEIVGSNQHAIGNEQKVLFGADSFNYEEQSRLGLLIQRAVTFLQYNEPEDGYIGAFSGGKDSIVIKELAKMAGVRVEWRYHVTTVDPPEIIYYIKEKHPDVIFVRPRYGNLFARIPKKGVMPTRAMRWCCNEYKEFYYHNRSVILGIRIAEGSRRKNIWPTCIVVNPKKKEQKNILPIRLWEDKDVWNFIGYRGIPYCKLYDEGFTRLGCVGCPLTSAKHIEREFNRWPKFKSMWLSAFKKLWDAKNGTTQKNGEPWIFSRYFDNVNDAFEWWAKGMPRNQISRLDQIAIAPPSNRKGGVSCPTNPQEILTQVTLVGKGD